MTPLFRFSPVLLSLLLLATGVVSGCAPSATLHGVRPPEVPLPGARTVRLDPPVGQYARAAQPCFFQEFLRSGRFSLTSGDDADAVLRLEVDDSVDDRASWDRVTWQREYTRTIIRTLPDGRRETVEETVTEPVSASVRRVERDIALDCTLTARAPDGGLLATASTRKRSRETYGGRTGWQEWGAHKDPNTYVPDIPPAWEKAEKLACEAGTELARKVTPQSYAMNVPLSKGEGEAQAALIERGAGLADEGRWEQAASLWRQALERDPASASALYNLGVYHEAKATEQGLLEARRLYERALENGPAEDAANAVARVDRRLKDMRALREQFGED